MGKKFSFWGIISSALIFGLVSLIIFLTIPDIRLRNGTFWIAYICGFLFSTVFLIAMIFKDMGAKGQVANRMLPLGVSGTITLILYVAGFVFSYVPSDTYALEIVVFAILYVFCFIYLGYVFLTAERIRENNNNQRKKVRYIRDLVGTVDLYASQVTQANLKKAMNDLSEEIRFSDPMLDETVSAIEDKIFLAVNEFSNYIDEQEWEELGKAVQNVSGLIKLRNAKVRSLK